MLSFEGRRSGKRYAFTLGYFQWGDDQLLSISSRPWVKNLRGGVPVRLLVRGRWLDAAAAAAEDVESVSALLGRFAAQKGPRAARGLRLGLPGNRLPTAHELREAAALTSVITFQLGD